MKSLIIVQIVFSSNADIIIIMMIKKCRSVSGKKMRKSTLEKKTGHGYKKY